MVDVAIIGAGLTGLSAAYHFEKNGFFNYTLVEKDDTFGGLCRSVEQDGFTFDYTGHLLHINDEYFSNFMHSIVGLEHFNTIKRRSFIYSQDVFTSYPYQINLHGLPTATIVECVKGFIERSKKKHSRSYYKWVLSQFGEGFGKHFFFPYQQKIFDFSIHRLSASWTGRFVPSTSLEQIIKGAIAPIDDSIGYNAQFFYPKKDGIIFWINKLAQQLKNPIHLQRTVSRISLADKRIIFSDGSDIRYQILINTMPLDTLLGLIEEPAHSNVKSAKKYLKCNSVINFNIGVNRPDLSNKHWVYYPEAAYPFYRIGFPHNFSDTMAPPGCSSLYGEVSSFKRTRRLCRDRLYNALNTVKKLWRIHDKDILTQKIIHISHAYVIFDQWRDTHLPSILTELAQFDLHSVGRYGAWKYSSMQEGLLDGKNIAEKILIDKGAL